MSITKLYTLGVQVHRLGDKTETEVNELGVFQKGKISIIIVALTRSTFGNANSKTQHRLNKSSTKKFVF
jgi:hypothetical protein